MVRYVILGNGVSSIAAIEAIRDRDEEGNITVISDEPHHTYSRPLISYLLAGEVSEEALPYRDEDFYEEKDVEVILEEEVVSLDLEENLVFTDNAREISFDKLLIATGGSPILPDVEGKDLEGVFTFTELDDVEKIRDYIDANDVREAVVIGGGLIGLKTTEALLELDIKVDVVELADRVMSATFDKKASRLIEKRLKERGCRVITENTAAEVGGEEEVEEVVLEDGEELACDIVMFAIGVAPNIEFAESTEIQLDRGVLVDNRMRTNVQDVYATGDVVEERNLITGETRPIAIWPSAHKQGRIAGANMAGDSKEQEGGLPMNSIELCGLPTISVGLTDPNGEGYEILEEFDEDNYVYKKLVLDDDKIVGSIFVNAIDRAGIYTGLIRNKINVSKFKDQLLSDDFGLIVLPKDYRKHLVTGPGIEV